MTEQDEYFLSSRFEPVLPSSDRPISNYSGGRKYKVLMTLYVDSR